MGIHIYVAVVLQNDSFMEPWLYNDFSGMDDL